MARKNSSPSPAEWIRLHARPLQGGIIDFDAVVRLGCDAHIVLLGGSTHGTAEFASRESPALPPAAPGSLDALFHHSGLSRCLLNLRTLTVAEVPPDSFVYERLPERVAGVVMNPARPDIQQYVPGKLAEKYDVYFFYDKTLAVAPLDAGPVPAGMEAYPTGE